MIALIGTVLYAYRNKAVTVPINEKSEVEEKKMTKESEVISVTVTYPTIPGNSRTIATTNTVIANDINKRIADFEKDAEDSLGAPIGLPKEIKSTMTGSPSIEEKNDRYVAVFMGMEWYLRGAAHPGHTIDTYIYDYAREKLVSVGDMFKPGSDYLKKFSEYAYQDFLAQSKIGDNGFVFDQSMVTEGTKPTKENFSRILPIRDGLVIYFSEYQVAPYAAGPQQVVIPYSELKDIIDPSGVLGMYIK